jgi:hypothetical protein
MLARNVIVSEARELLAKHLSRRFDFLDVERDGRKFDYSRQPLASFKRVVTSLLQLR